MIDFFSIKHILVNIPLGNGYSMSYIEAIGTVFGLLCIWYASREKIINYPFGIINVVLFCIIFYQIQLYGNLLLQIFFAVTNIYGWYAWSRQTSEHEHILKIRWLSKTKRIILLIISLVSILLLGIHIDDFFAILTKISLSGLHLLGLNISSPILEKDAFPIMDSAVTVLSVIAMLLMTRKYIENWLVWMLIDVLSVILYSKQGVYAMALEYIILFVIAANGTRLWVNQARNCMD